MWLYPLPALIASIGFAYILFIRVNALKEIRYAVVILILGIADLHGARLAKLASGHFGRGLTSTSAGSSRVMAEMVKTPAPLPPSYSGGAQCSAWAPLREPLFRSLWIAAIISYIGTWMQSVGAGWMMTMITGSPLMVGLVQAAVALPVFLVILPAGALADMVDRRRFLLITQGWMVLAAGALGVLTLLHVVDAVDSAGLHLPAGSWRRDERSGMAGHHAGTGSHQNSTRPRLLSIRQDSTSRARWAPRSAAW